MSIRAGASLLAAAAIALPALASDVEVHPSEPSESASQAQSESQPESGPSLVSGRVERSVVTTNVVDREPQDEVRELTNDHTQVFYFTELSGFQGQTLLHRWSYAGELMAEVPFAVGGPRWRVHSSKSLLPEWLGEWTVSVVDSSGQVLASETLVVREAPSAPPPVAAPAAPAQEPAGEPTAPAPQP